MPTSDLFGPLLLRLEDLLSRLVAVLTRAFHARSGRLQLLAAPPTEVQTKDIGWLLTLGELFTLVAYGQLILENAKIYGVYDELVDQIFDFMVRDFSKYALELYSKTSSTAEQMELCTRMIAKPVADQARFDKVLAEAYSLRDQYHWSD